MLVQEVATTAASGGKSLVFVQSRKRVEELSRHLQANGLRSHYHHASLSHERRQEIEDGFRRGEFDTLVATSALEMGLNLPARKVVLYDLQTFDGIFFTPLTTNTVWQRAGRAGRAGFDDQGEVVLFAARFDSHAKTYQQGVFEPIRSGLANKQALAEQVIAEVASGLARTPTQLSRVFAQSLAAYQRTLPDVKAIITEMCQAGMLREVSPGAGENTQIGTTSLAATRLGHVASRHLLTPATVLLFKHLLDAEPCPTFLDLLLAAACSDECDSMLSVDFEEIEHLSSLLVYEPTSLLHRPASSILQVLGMGGRRFLSSIKMALCVRAWTWFSDASLVSSQYACYPFEVERLISSMGRLLLAMAGIIEQEPNGASAGEDAKSSFPLRERLSALQQMVATGLNEEAATLLLIDGLGVKMAKRLHSIGIHDVEDLALAEVAEICQVKGIREKRAQRWIDQAQALIKEKSAFYYKETEAPAQLAPAGWSDESVDPYRLRRALDLTISVADGNGWVVTGGLDPHLVQMRGSDLLCDCPDASKGHYCKHRLAVRLHRGDQQLSQLVHHLHASSGDHLDLFHLWFDNSFSSRRENTYDR